MKTLHQVTSKYEAVVSVLFPLQLPPDSSLAKGKQFR